jgi:enoyl-CoA hydratase/carnithine racemase
MEEYKSLIWETVEPGIGLLTLNRPEFYNAVNGDMMIELEDFWRLRLNDEQTKVIIIKGAGEKGFCAGLDMKWAINDTKKHQGDVWANFRFQARLARINLAMRRAPQPIIAMVHGAAAGEGFSFTLASDIRVITPDARFCAAYINIGLGGADMTCSYFLPRLIGAGRAYEFMLTGDFMSCEEAVNLGLVSKVVPREELYDAALTFARKLMTKNPMGLYLTKEAINMNLDAGGLEQAICMEDRNQVMLTLATGLKSTV